MTDTIADLISRVKNAQMSNQNGIAVPFSKFKVDILNVMKKNNIIEETKILEEKNLKIIKVNFGTKRISHIKRLSKPGRRYYVKASQIPKPLRGLGLVIISTPKGVISGHEAKKLNIGGELICEVW
jgi:small subunit ribosomal protein S8